MRCMYFGLGSFEIEIPNKTTSVLEPHTMYLHICKILYISAKFRCSRHLKCFRSFMVYPRVSRINAKALNHSHFAGALRIGEYSK
jgi:hypothetical protein